MAKRPPPAQSDTATEWLRSRVPMRKEQWLRLNQQAREHGFFASGIVRLSLIKDLQKAAVRGVEKGTTFATFKKDIGAKLEKEWAGTVANPSARMENIFRTNLQKAYSQGRRNQLLDPATLSRLPFWTLVPVFDLRTSEVCIEFVRRPVVLPATHPFWKTRTPPLHFMCRTAIRALTREQAEGQGITKRAPRTKAQEGFGGVEETKPDAKTTKGVSERIARKAKAKKPKPRPRNDKHDPRKVFSVPLSELADVPSLGWEPGRVRDVLKGYRNNADFPPIHIGAGQGERELIDGNHRLWVARQLGLKTITVRYASGEARKPTGKAAKAHDLEEIADNNWRAAERGGHDPDSLALWKRYKASEKK